MRSTRRRCLLGVVRRGTSRLRAHPLLFNIFSAAVTHVVYTRFEADKGIMDALVGLGKKVGAGENNSRRACPGDVTMGNAIR